jgi:hypothetical protein
MAFQMGSVKMKNRKSDAVKIGITIHIRDENQSIWENSVHQTAVFLHMALKHIPFVEKLVFVNCGGFNPKDSGVLKFADGEVMELNEAHESLDLLIEVGAQLPVEWIDNFAARGGKVIAYRLTNDLVIDFERMAFALPASLTFQGAKYHAIWATPSFEQVCKSYYTHGFNAPFFTVPSIWSPLFVGGYSSELATEFVYKTGAKRWRVGILEPNLCSTKTCHLPLLIADQAHRKNTRMIESVFVFNTTVIKEHASFIEFAKSLDLVNQGIATFEGRLPIHMILGKLADAVISHQWLNDENHLYYEALYGGFPLIHNSDFLDGCGYRYETFDCIDGGLSFMQAFKEHDINLEQYKKSAAEFLLKIHPESKEVIDAYAHRIREVF